MKKWISVFALLLTAQSDLFAFCGFYIAKADASLFNKASQVILVRDGNHTSITMSSDYQGPVKEFAMVVPVPSVLKREQIRTVNKTVFSRLDAYTGPRLVEYYDQSPCMRYELEMVKSVSRKDDVSASEVAEAPSVGKKNKVTIEARYEVDEYEILILSAEESSGLESWLTENGYRIPPGAAEVLHPYIKAGMKFFVAKVNLKKFNQSGNNELSPLQISFDSPKFMLPIRLGMANANGDQDLIIYTLTRTGRVETVNYRTGTMPSNRDVPEFVEGKFGKFFTDVFTRAWKREDRGAIMLEYAWNIPGQAPVKCDPCPETDQGPLTSLNYEELRDLGVTWVSPSGWNNSGYMQGGTGYMGPLFVTRLHARYNRELYPQDLVFQETSNRENFQCRYVIHRPSGDLDCDEAENYLQNVVQRRQRELMEMAFLAGWNPNEYPNYVGEYRAKLKSKGIKEDTRNFLPIDTGNHSDPGEGNGNLPLLVLSFIAATILILIIPHRKPFLQQ